MQALISMPQPRPMMSIWGGVIDEEKGDFIGKKPLASASKDARLFGIKCLIGEPLISAVVEVDGCSEGVVTAGATSPFLNFFFYALWRRQ